MAQYNPNQPDALGNEWVGIAPAAYPMDSGTERGYRFTNTGVTNPGAGIYYLDSEPPSVVLAQYPLLAVYPSGLEAATGEVKSVLVPVSSVAITGGFSLPSGFTAVQSVQSPSDRLSIDFGTTPVHFVFSFDVSPLSAELSNKRIMNVAIRYTSTGDWATGNPFGTTSTLSQGTEEIPFGTGYLNGNEAFAGTDITEVSRISFGEINPYAVDIPQLQVYPWRNDSIQQFAAAAPVPMRFHQRWFPTIAVGLSIEYVALEITYCTENRLLYGAANIGDLPVVIGQNSYTVPGPNYVTLRTTSAFATGTALPAGDYSLTSTMGDPGDRSFSVSSGFALDSVTPTAQALRELYPMVNSSLRGIEVDRAEQVGDRFDVEESRVLPYLGLATNRGGFELAAGHAYGRQIPIPVFAGSTPTHTWGALTADPTPYPWVRYWARRPSEGCTGVPPLTLTTGAASVSITCAAFDALPEIADGWKQVTLRFPAPPTLAGTGTLSWSSPVVTGAQWQILSSGGQSINTPSNFSSVVAAPTYPPSGLRFSDDASFLFFQDPPVVTGIASSVLTGPLNPVSLDCGQPADCIPTGASFVSITWTPITVSHPSAVPTFGYYEVQRQDDVDSAWETTHTLFTPESSSIPDREARIGVTSRYRVRVVTSYGIEGAFSAVTAAAVPATAPALWLFTSTWDLFGAFSVGGVEVGGAAPPPFAPMYYEAGAVTYQEMYGRNNRVAFHSTERGGETFNIQLLTNQGPVAPGALGQALDRFRTLAWNAIDEIYSWRNPYVCVRDGNGNRWYAQVQIPDMAANRRLPATKLIEVTNVTVVEILDDPTPFDGGVMSQGLDVALMSEIMEGEQS